MTYDPVMATLQQAEAVAAQVQAPQVHQPHLQQVGIIQNPMDYAAPVQTHVQPQAEVYYQAQAPVAAQPQYVEQPQYVQQPVQPQYAPVPQQVQPQPVVQHVNPQYVQPPVQAQPPQYAPAPTPHNQQVAVPTPTGGEVGFSLSREALTAPANLGFNGAEWFLKAGKGDGRFTIRPRNAESALAPRLVMRPLSEINLTLDFNSSILGESLSVTNNTYAFSADGQNLLGYVDSTLERFKHNWPALVQYAAQQGRAPAYICLKGSFIVNQPIKDLAGVAIEEIPVGTVLSFDTTKTTWNSVQAIIAAGIATGTLAFNEEGPLPNQLVGKVDVVLRAQAKVSRTNGTGYTAVDFLPVDATPAEAAKAAKGRKTTA
jgi:hypothetical protein